MGQKVKSQATLYSNLVSIPKAEGQKFSKLQMRRGVDHSTALSTRLQLPSILSEGARMSRKCLRLGHFLSCFCDFMIEFISQHNTEMNRRLLLSRFHRATSRAAGDHFNKWGLSGSQLWTELVAKTRRCIPNRSLTPLNIKLIRTVIDPPFSPPKRKLIESQLPNVIKNTPSQSSNDEAACESEDLESENLEYKLSEPPSPTPTPQ